MRCAVPRSERGGFAEGPCKRAERGVSPSDLKALLEAVRAAFIESALAATHGNQPRRRRPWACCPPPCTKAEAGWACARGRPGTKTGRPPARRDPGTQFERKSRAPPRPPHGSVEACAWPFRPISTSTGNGFLAPERFPFLERVRPDAYQRSVPHPSASSP